MLTHIGILLIRVIFLQCCVFSIIWGISFHSSVLFAVLSNKFCERGICILICFIDLNNTYRN